LHKSLKCVIKDYVIIMRQYLLLYHNFGISACGTKVAWEMDMDSEAKLSRESTSSWDHAFRQSMNRELVSFRRMLPELLKRCQGSYVALSGGKVVDEDENEIALAERVTNRFKDGFVLIKHVVENELKNSSLHHSR
jgi:hypothetical protein